MNLLRYLKQPYPISHHPWLIVTIPSVIVAFVLFLMQVFGMNSPHMNKWLIILGFSMITAISISIFTFIFPLFFKQYYSEKKWTVWKSLLNHLCILSAISLGNSIFDILSTKPPIEIYFIILREYFFITFLIGLLPTFAVTIIIHNEKLKQNLRDAQRTNEFLTQNKDDNNSLSIQNNQNEIELYGSTKEKLKILPKNILFIEASGNYAIINYTDNNNNTTNKQLRATIGQIESQLLPYDYIMRCHRAFLVNMTNVYKMEGNSQGLQLSIPNIKEKIPVSRTYIHIIQNKLCLR